VKQLVFVIIIFLGSIYLYINLTLGKYWTMLPSQKCQIRHACTKQLYVHVIIYLAGSD